MAALPSDTLFGGSGNDTFIGDGDNTSEGLAGVDVLGKSGNDVVRGGAGTDTVQFVLSRENDPTGIEANIKIHNFGFGDEDEPQDPNWQPDQAITVRDAENNIDHLFSIETIIGTAAADTVNINWNGQVNSFGYV